MTETKFIINKHLVCTNPNIFFDIHTVWKEYKGEFKIKTGCMNGKWEAGYNYKFPEDGNSGGGSPVNFDNQYGKRTFYDTEKEAVLAELDYFIQQRSTPKRVVNLLKDLRNTLKHEQLALF